MKVSIFGSCVSRDSLDFTPDLFEINCYFARSSFASLSSKPYQGSMDFLDLMESDFQKKMVKHDLAKDVFLENTFSDSDVILIDLIDERFDLIQFACGSNCTLSLELSHVIKSINDYKVFRSNSLNYLGLFEKGFKKFIKSIEVPLSRIRIIETYWAEADDKNERIDTKLSKKNNLKLFLLYSIVKKYLPDTSFIKVPSQYLITSNTHKWGAAPFHYIDEFYYYILDEIKKVPKLNEKR